MDHICDQLCIVRHDATDPSKAIVSFQDFETAYNKYHERDLQKVAGRQAKGKKVHYKSKNIKLIYQQFWHESNPYRSMINAMWERADKFGMSVAKFDYLWRLTEFYVPAGESAAHNRWMRERTMWKDTTPPLRKCVPFPFTDPRDPTYSKTEPAPISRSKEYHKQIADERRNPSTEQISSQEIRSGSLTSIPVLQRINLTAHSTESEMEIERISLFTVRFKLFNPAQWKDVDWMLCLS